MACKPPKNTAIHTLVGLAFGGSDSEARHRQEYIPQLDMAFFDDFVFWCQYLKPQ
ncbi:MAG: hypothetical protein LBJ67_14440 [Planctomycetaceae bacterium]|jgi:hypothetical protein|nr:hypothetical protein [Planctomycetaceae bacterium]